MHTTVTVRYRLEGIEPEQLIAACDQLMEHLVGEADDPVSPVTDPSIGGKMTTGEVEVSLNLDGYSPPFAVRSAVERLRVATMDPNDDRNRSWLEETAIVAVHAERADEPAPVEAAPVEVAERSG